MDVVDRRDFDLPAGGVFERNEAVVVSFILNLVYFGFDDFGLALIADGDGVAAGLVGGYDEYDDNDDDGDDCRDNEDDEVFGGFGGGCGVGCGVGVWLRLGAGLCVEAGTGGCFGSFGLAGLVGVIMGGFFHKRFPINYNLFIT